MSANVMLASLLKEQRIENNLSIAEVAVRTRLDPSLISRFESGKRLPTRDHIQRLSAALLLDEEALMVSWLVEKLNKVLDEEKREELRQKALDIINGNMNHEKLFAPKTSKIALSQEKIINNALIALEQLRAHEPENWKRICARGKLRLTRDLCALSGNPWEETALQSVIEEGKTQPDKDFQAHLQLHGMHEVLSRVEEQGKSASAQEIHATIKRLYPEWKESHWVHETFSLAHLAQVWKEEQENYPNDSALAWLVVSIHLNHNGFPFFSLSKKPINDKEDMIYLSEYLGDWLLTEIRRVV